MSFLQSTRYLNSCIFLNHLMPMELKRMDYELIRSRRKTLAVEYKGGRMTVRAPWHATRGQIERFLQAHRQQIEAYLEKEQAQEKALAEVPRLTHDELMSLAKQAKEVIPQRVAYYAPLVGAGYGRITIRSQRTRWGSCSAQGNLSFNCLLMLANCRITDFSLMLKLSGRHTVSI